MNRKLDPLFDQRVADWLEEDPTLAPRAVLETVNAAFPSLPQRRAWRTTWRFSPMNRLALPLGAALAIVLGVALVAPRLVNQVASPTSQPTPTTLGVAPTAVPTPSPRLDWSDLGGRILVEHLGNAIDESEMPTAEFHAERRRLYFMDPATMSRKAAVELLPGQPPAGKLNADVSMDGATVVFMDTAEDAQVWLANLDGTGLRKLSQPCTCSELDPAFDPTGTKVAYVHLENGHRNSTSGANMSHVDARPTTRTWLEIRDIATGAVTVLDQTRATASDAWPAQPSWSPDGKQIVFDRITWSDGQVVHITGALEIVDVVSGDVSRIELPGIVPGDADWSPDGTRILFGDHPVSEMGSLAELPPKGMYTVSPDGDNLVELDQGTGGSFLPDGRILFQNNVLWVMNADGSELHEVKRQANDLTELQFGFVYIAHWVPPR